MDLLSYLKASSETHHHNPNFGGIHGRPAYSCARTRSCTDTDTDADARTCARARARALDREKEIAV